MSLEHSPSEGMPSLPSEGRQCISETDVGPGLCSTHTLAKMACIGGGPEMEYAGRFPTYTERAWTASPDRSFRPRFKIPPNVNSNSSPHRNRRSPYAPAAQIGSLK